MFRVWIFVCMFLCERIFFDKGFGFAKLVMLAYIYFISSTKSKKWFWGVYLLENWNHGFGFLSAYVCILPLAGKRMKRAWCCCCSVQVFASVFLSCVYPFMVKIFWVCVYLLWCEFEHADFGSYAGYVVVVVSGLDTWCFLVHSVGWRVVELLLYIFQLDFLFKSLIGFLTCLLAWLAVLSYNHPLLLVSRLGLMVCVWNRWAFSSCCFYSIISWSIFLANCTNTKKVLPFLSFSLNDKANLLFLIFWKVCPLTGKWWKAVTSLWPVILVYLLHFTAILLHCTCCICIVCIQFVL